MLIDYLMLLFGPVVAHFAVFDVGQVHNLNPVALLFFACWQYAFVCRVVVCPKRIDFGVFGARQGHPTVVQRNEFVY